MNLALHGFLLQGKFCNLVDPASTAMARGRFANDTCEPASM
jgi:hypothetical protein